MVDCGVLYDIPDGAVSTPQGTLYGATASYSCNSGYRLVGNITRECQADGRWSAEGPPYCGSELSNTTAIDRYIDIHANLEEVIHIDCETQQLPPANSVSYCILAL